VKLDVGIGEIAIGHRLPELCLIVAVVDARQDVALLDVLTFLDRLSNNLTELLGSDRDVLVLGDDISGTGQQGSRLSRLLDGDERGLYFGRSSQRTSVNLVTDRRSTREDHQRHEYRNQTARTPLGLARDAERFELANARRRTR